MRQSADRFKQDCRTSSWTSSSQPMGFPVSGLDPNIPCRLARLILSVVFHDDGLGRSTDIAEQQGRSGENVFSIGRKDSMAV